jgi:prophage regulatory protein
MKASLNNATNGQGRDSSELTAERATKAAYYLKEALALLGSSPDASTPIDSKRESDRLLRLPEVLQLTGLRRSAIYEQMRRGSFPRSVKAGPRAATWSEAAIQAWISDRIDEGSV